ncbi:MAG TPA: hypothetical protein VFS71_17030 [Flavobacterium sp.]|uniref:hypothetical protein n=1 Tax=Flavobacterium sp. TaxID=239 RepID=UPI002DB753C6|nr:hypothetical protein [Flavobacterium sp.]HEU4791395.1 hypothetical protein [Flavobacterium sp.]
MKYYIITLMSLGCIALSYSQHTKINDIDANVLKMTELPEVVIKSAGKDFSKYLPDNNPDMKVVGLQQKFIAYDLGKDYLGAESYLLTLEIENGSLAATYDGKGKLLGVVENYKNVKLPSAVIYSVCKKYPGWSIVNDKFLYTQEDGDIIKKQYHIQIKKDNETRKLVVHPNGDIIKET